MLMKGEKIFMKLLKIENNSGKYSIDGTIYKAIEEISKEDILTLINKIFEEVVEIEEPTADNDINSPAQKIIYTKIFEKLKELIASKQDIIDRNQKLFAEAYKKYKFDDK